MERKTNKNKQVVCLYCGEKMKGGTTQSTGELIWNSGVKKKMVGASNALKDTIILSKFNLLSGSACVAYSCGECKKIIIDYSDGNVDVN